MVVGFCKWGDNLALRIPKSAAQALNLHTGSRVELAIENGALVLRPIVRRKRTRVYTIERIAERDDQGKRAAGGRLGRSTWERGLVTLAAHCR